MLHSFVTLEYGSQNSSTGLCLEFYDGFRVVKSYPKTEWE